MRRNRNDQCHRRCHFRRPGRRACPTVPTAAARPAAAPLSRRPDRALEDPWEDNMKTKPSIAVVACVALFVSGCGSSPQDLIVGKWEAGQGGIKVTAEFARDGTAKLTM